LQYIPATDIAKVIESARNWEWRVVIALARFAGLRVPSELVALTWADVNLETNRLVVRSPKLEKSSTGGVRVVPILPELLPYLRDAFDAAPEGEKLVVPTLGKALSGNLRTEMRRAIERAGLVPWQRTFQNLRSSFVIDLHEQFPAHVASRWAGHTDKTALAHYLDVLDSHFDRASGQKSGAQSGAVAVQNAVQTVSDAKSQEMPIPSEVFERCTVRPLESSQVITLQRLIVAPT